MSTQRGRLRQRLNDPTTTYHVVVIGLRPQVSVDGFSYRGGEASHAGSASSIAQELLSVSEHVQEVSDHHQRVKPRSVHKQSHGTLAHTYTIAAFVSVVRLYRRKVSMNSEPGTDSRPYSASYRLVRNSAANRRFGMCSRSHV